MKRLTKRFKDDGRPHWNIKGGSGEAITEAHTKALYRLAELEDKLESGQLVELPCKIHDRLYTHTKVFGKWQIEELICWGYHSDSRNLLFMDCQNARTGSSNSLRAFTVEEFGKTVFTDKAQAEARLKELQEK